MEQYDIFISYSRHDLEKVKEIMAEIEQSTNARCWMDLDGIESGEQFENVIISAINRSDTFLFMLSEYSMKSEWTLDELDFAKKKGKRLVIVAIENVKMSDIFYFRYHKYDQINWDSLPQRGKLLRDIKKWISKTNDSSKKREQVSIKDLPNLSDNLQGRRNVKTNKSRTQIIVRIVQTMRHGWLWIAGSVGLLVIALLLYVFSEKKNVNNDLPNSVTLVDSLNVISTDTTSSFEGHEVLADNKIPDDYILVSGGQFTYKGNFYEDHKVHKTEIDSFYICKYELTQGEYQRVTGIINKENYMWLVQNSWYLDKGPQYSEVKGDSIPVRGNYKLFAEYCNARSKQEGYDGFYVINGNSIRILPDGNGYRLVTPYEWIFAAYGGNLNKIERYLGGKTLSDVAWHYGNSKNKPHPVGLKNPNVIGVYDMQGNAPELLQGDTKRKCYVSMCGGYNVSDWNYPQTYDPTYIWSPRDDDSEWTYGTRIALVPKTFKNDNLRVQYDY